MPINFRGGPPKGTSARPTDPIKIFQARPSLESQVNDLWRGQARALEDWHGASENDILIALNTGAGKSIIGTLICQSWLNGGVENPVYLCATNDLVDQTAREASNLALKFTTRTGGEFSNELFESGQGFLITSYQTLFNAKTRLRGALSPGGLLFDDAHVGEPIIRSQFTLTIDRNKHSTIFGALISVIEAHLAPADRQALRLILNIHGAADTFLCPPDTGAALSETLSGLSAHFGGDGLANIHFPYLLLATHFDACAVVVRTDGIELSPPFLPTRTLAALRSPDVRRVYLSATLKAESEFVRAYGIRPGRIIEPEVDAGNGERTIINAAKLKDRSRIVDWALGQAQKGKLLIATPSRAKAAQWIHIAKPSETDNFNAELKAFRSAKKGGFVLAGRFDGIDLPDATCRLMIMAGLPAGGSALETYLWEVFELRNLLSARVATRVTQLFGRIIRGRNDFGTFVVQGSDLTNWLARDRNLALLPELLQKQIKLGDVLTEDYEVNDFSSVSELYNQVLGREESWLEYYRTFVEQQELDDLDAARRIENEAIQLKSAVAEAKFIEAFWTHRYSEAANVLEPVIDPISVGDSKLAGWLNLWVGAARSLAGTAEDAREHYRIARSRLPLRMSLPTEAPGEEADLGEPSHSADAALRALVFAKARTFGIQSSKFQASAAVVSSSSASPASAEDAYRAVGAALGYTASRPDEDTGTGPDVLWVDEINSAAITFELKTGKTKGAELSKREVGQSHNHVQWMADTHPGLTMLQHFIVGYDLRVASNANPDPTWKHSEPIELVKLTDAFLAEARRIRNVSTDGKPNELKRLAAEGQWSSADVIRRLTSRAMDC